jgi:manganese-dependent inorganic pyrophosphatase
MLMSILSDTRNMKRNVTDADREAYETLKDIAEIEDIDAFYRNVAYALTSYGTLSNREIYETDYKEYEASGIRFCIADVNAYGEENVIELAERMDELMALHYDESGLDLMFAIINNKSDDESENMMYMTAFPESAKNLLQKIYGNYDRNRFFIFRKNLSRKTDIVPALTAALKQLTTGTQEKTGITSQ